MEKYISREALKRIYMEKGIEKGKLKLSTAINELELLPAADVAPVRHGKWEWFGPCYDGRGNAWGTCSVCNVRQRLGDNHSFCPNCGACMYLDG